LQFIPCFNIFWWYRIMPGLSVTLGNMRREQDPDTSEQAGFWFAIASFVVLLVGGYVPGVAILFPVFFSIWLILTNRAKNRYLEIKLGIRNVKARSTSPTYWGE